MILEPFTANKLFFCCRVNQNVIRSETPAVKQRFDAIVVASVSVTVTPSVHEMGNRRMLDAVLFAYRQPYLTAAACKMPTYESTHLLAIHLPSFSNFFCNDVKSSIVPNSGSMLLKSDISYPISAIGDLKIGDNHTAPIPNSLRYSAFSSIPTKMYKKKISNGRNRKFLLHGHRHMVWIRLPFRSPIPSLLLSLKDLGYI